MNLRRLAAADADPREYIAGANASFGHWGDEATFAWAFRGDAELLFLDDAEGRAFAASGITYRTLQTGQTAAIMTGSWTLPAMRSRGAFARLTEAVREIARERDAFLLAFQRAENPSSRHFIALGAGIHPTFYCRSLQAPQSAGKLDAIDPDPSLFPSTFAYSPDDWHKQFLARPHAHVECLGRRGEWAALVERTAEFDRVHAVSHPHALPLLAARAHAVGRRLFWYTTSMPSMECQWTDGFLETLPASPTDWQLQNGDRM